MQSDRNVLFDYAKGIGIILVVYGHVARGVFNAGLPIDAGLYTQVDKLIYSFHMPLFFFLSGLFFLPSLQKRSYFALMRGKVDSILFPYVLWSLLQGGIEYGLSSYTNGKVGLDEIFALFWQPRAQFWFLYTLFGTFAIAGILYWKNSAAWTGAMLVLSIAIQLYGLAPVDLFLFNSFAQYFVFFALGVSAAPLVARLDGLRPGVLALIALAFIAEQVIYLEQPVGARDVAGNLIGLGLAVSGIAATLAASQGFARLNWNWLAYIGRHSMEIYLIHILASSGARIGLQKGLDVTDASLHLAIGMLFGIGVPLLVVYAARRGGITWLFTAPSLRPA
jgi:fucose 4-O-acetylase-like acetyltransferase